MLFRIEYRILFFVILLLWLKFVLIPVLVSVSSFLHFHYFVSMSKIPNLILHFIFYSCHVYWSRKFRILSCRPAMNLFSLSILLTPLKPPLSSSYSLHKTIWYRPFIASRWPMVSQSAPGSFPLVRVVDDKTRFTRTSPTSSFFEGIFKKSSLSLVPWVLQFIHNKIIMYSQETLVFRPFSFKRCYLIFSGLFDCRLYVGTITPRYVK